MNLGLRKIRSCLLRPFDRRVRFRDLARIARDARRPRSPVIQFYSPQANIGNYTPVLGIQRMIGCATDTWSAHDSHVDFDFINRNYACAIIGGAGLLHGVFQPFWTRFVEQCRIPYIVWGVGLCCPDGGPRPVDQHIGHTALSRADLVDLRDDITADYYGISDCHIGPCPTLAYLESFALRQRRRSHVLVAAHTELVPEQDLARISEAVGHVVGRVKETNNEQCCWLGVHDVIRRLYVSATMVVTTRLHGAIISYGLGIPYLAISYDKKLDAFYRLYGNGLLQAHTNITQDTIDTVLALSLAPPNIAEVHRFGRTATQWLAQVADVEFRHG